MPYFVEVSIMCAGYVIGLSSLYFTAYSKTKGKNRALQEDVKRLEEDKQSIVAKYRAETEELKRQHTLDIEKRKYLYESKKEQFLKYFELLDKFHNKQNAQFEERILPMMSKLFESCMEENHAPYDKAIAEFAYKVGEMFNEANKELLTLRCETNSIRLVSSAELDKLLQILESRVSEATADTEAFIKIMTTLEFFANPSIQIPYKEKIEQSGQAVKKAHEALRLQMKKELNEI